MMLILGGIIPVHAAPGDQLLEINNPTPVFDDRFGWSVATTPTGNLLVGAVNDDTGATNAGSVYLFDGNDGSLLLTINNPTPDTNDGFGVFVATTPTGDLLVGAGQDNTGATSAGSVYLFDGNDGSLLLTINNPTPDTGDYFGYSVAATSAGDILVSAYNDNTGASNTGSVYLFDGNDGSLLLTINNPTPEVDDLFGKSIATTSTDDILVGAYQDNTGATSAGSAYLFDGNDGSLLLTINNPTPDTNDFFGYFVATTPTGDLLVGAHYDDTGASDAGSVYLFDGNDGSLLLTINNPTPAVGDWFGFSVAATSTGNILTGAHYDDTGASDAGSVYLFDGNDGSLLLTINNPSPIANDVVGYSVATTLTGDLLVGAFNDDIGGGLHAGSVFLFEGISDATSTTGTVEILTTCGVQFNSGAPINYGAVLPGDTSDEQTLTLYNSGNIAGDILVSGSDWVDDTPTTQMTISDTKYSTITGDYTSKTSLQLTDQTLMTLNPQNNTNTFWQLQANLLDSLFSGSLTQTVDFSVTC